MSWENLRLWELKEIKIGHKALRYAKVFFIIGVVSIAGGTFRVLSAQDPERNQVAVMVSSGDVVCGSLFGSNATAMDLKVKDEFGELENVSIPYSDIQELRLLESCPES